MFTGNISISQNNDDDDDDDDGDDDDDDDGDDDDDSFITFNKNFCPPTTCHENVKKNILKDIYNLECNLQKYISEFPVIGFNSGKYDLNLVKKKIMKHLNMYEKQSTKFVVKRNNNYICVSNGNLKFLDITNYLAPGCSYDQFLKAYKCSAHKGYFPYEWFDNFEKLNYKELPAFEYFYSSLKNCNVLEEDYIRYTNLLNEGKTHEQALEIMCLTNRPNTGEENYRELQELWKNQMSNFKDYLIYYNNLDTEPFVEGIEKLMSYYQNEGIDIFKESITLPGIARKLLYKSVSPSVHFSLFDKKNEDLYHTFKHNIIGGPSIVFSRYAESNKSKIREHEYKENSSICKRIVGYDSNALYLWSMSQNMPTGVMTRRQEKNNFVKESSETYLLAMKWLNFVQHKEGIYIQHAFNSKQEKRIPPYRVDGYCPSLNTVYELNGCYYHFHDPDKCWITKRITNKDIIEQGKKRYERTLQREKYIESQGYKIITKWECEFRTELINNDELQEFVEQYKRPMDRLYNASPEIILKSVMNDTFFGAVEIDLEVPDNLKPYFSEMCPIFCTTDIPMSCIGSHMQEIAKELELSEKPRRLLVSGMRARKILIASPLLKWYINHGLIVTRVYQCIQFDSGCKAFEKFTNHVSNCRREADIDPSQTIKGETQKLIGNASYGSTIINKEKHERIYYVQGSEKASKEINSKYFKTLTELEDDFYEIAAYKKAIHLSLPITVGYFVLQYAKLRMLSFYYDFLDHFIDRRHFQLIQMDTDSLYIALAAESIDELIKPSLTEEYNRVKFNWLPRPDSIFDKRTPGLFKKEFEGDVMVALCSKMYCIENKQHNKSKFSCKGINKKQMEHPIDMYKHVLDTHKTETGVNKGIRLHNNTLQSYTQTKASFTYFYPKRKVLEDGNNTTYLDITLSPKSFDVINTDLMD